MGGNNGIMASHSVPRLGPKTETPRPFMAVSYLLCEDIRRLPEGFDLLLPALEQTLLTLQSSPQFLHNLKDLGFRVWDAALSSSTT
jgi:hypothetical protein